MSMFIRPFHHVTKTSHYTTHRVADFGDCPMNPLDIEESLSLVTAHYAGFKSKGTRPLTGG